MRIRGYFSKSKDVRIRGYFSKSKDMRIRGNFSKSKDMRIRGYFSKSKDVRIRGYSRSQGMWGSVVIFRSQKEVREENRLGNTVRVWCVCVCVCIRLCCLFGGYLPKLVFCF